MAGKNWMCHFVGNGAGSQGNVENGRYGQSEKRVQRRDFILAKMGKASALPTVTNGIIGARWRSAIFTKLWRPNP